MPAGGAMGYTLALALTVLILCAMAIGLPAGVVMAKKSLEVMSGSFLEESSALATLLL